MYRKNLSGRLYFPGHNHRKHFVDVLVVPNTVMCTNVLKDYEICSLRDILFKNSVPCFQVLQVTFKLCRTFIKFSRIFQRYYYYYFPVRRVLFANIGRGFRRAQKSFVCSSLCFQFAACRLDHRAKRKR